MKKILSTVALFVILVTATSSVLAQKPGGFWQPVVPADMTIRFEITEADTVGVCNGAIQLSTTHGTPPYTYEWSSGERTQNLSNLCASNYSVTVMDSYGRTVVAVAEVLTKVESRKKMWQFIFVIMILIGILGLRL